MIREYELAAAAIESGMAAWNLDSPLELLGGNPGIRESESGRTRP